MPKVNDWGPIFWHTLHICAHTYAAEPDSEDMKNMRAFLMMFAKHLPCSTCRKHFLERLEKGLPSDAAPPLASRDSLVSFLNELHNEINIRLGKRVFSLPQHICAYKPCPVLKRDTKKVLVLTIILLLSIYLITRTHRGCLPQFHKIKLTLMREVAQGNKKPHC